MKKLLIFVSFMMLLSCNSTKNVSKSKNNTAIVSKKPDNNKVVSHHDKQIIKQNTSEKQNKATHNSDPTQQETLTATSRVRVTTEGVKEYIKTYQYAAQQNMREFKIPASIALAQGILESGAGTAKLSVQANNHFGIKCHAEWTGEQIYHDDDAKDECFRKYKHASESWRDHALFLSTRKFYTALFDLPIDDYKAWAHGLKKAGYATDSKYPEKLISLIERYELYQYDAEVLGKPFESKLPKINDTNNNIITKKTHRVQKGDTLYSLSKRYNTTVEELKKINGLKDNSLKINQTLNIP